jgi:hypothetical protein
MEFKFIYSMTMTYLKQGVLLAQCSTEALISITEQLTNIHVDATQDCDYYVHKYHAFSHGKR